MVYELEDYELNVIYLDEFFCLLFSNILHSFKIKNFRVLRYMSQISYWLHYFFHYITHYFSMYLFGGLFYLFITFYKDFIFIAVLGSQENWEECTEVSHILLAPTHAHPPSLLTSITNRMVHFLRRINLHWHNLPPKVIIDFRVQSWGCMFCQFGQMFNDANTTVEYHTE